MQMLYNLKEITEELQARMGDYSAQKKSRIHKAINDEYYALLNDQDWRFSRQWIGIDTVAPMSDGNVQMVNGSKAVKFTAVKFTQNTLNSCESTDGWAYNRVVNSFTLNSSLKKLGSYGYNVIKDDQTSATFGATYDLPAALNLTGKVFQVFCYISSAIVAANLEYIKIALVNAGGANFYKYYYGTGGGSPELTVGWNVLKFNIDTADEYSSPDKTVITSINVSVATELATQKIPAGTVVFDHFCYYSEEYPDIQDGSWALVPTDSNLKYRIASRGDSVNEYIMDTVFQGTSGELTYKLYKDIYVPNERITKIYYGTIAGASYSGKLYQIEERRLVNLLPVNLDYGNPTHYSPIGKTRVPIYNTGTVAVTADSTAVVGTGTEWILNKEMLLGKTINITDLEFEGIIKSITDDTNLVLSSAYTGLSATAQSYEIGERDAEKIQLYPMPDGILHIRLKVKLRPIALENDTDEPYVIPREWRNVLQERAYLRCLVGKTMARLDYQQAIQMANDGLLSMREEEEINADANPEILNAESNGPFPGLDKDGADPLNYYGD